MCKTPQSELLRKTFGHFYKSKTVHKQTIKNIVFAFTFN